MRCAEKTRRKMRVALMPDVIIQIFGNIFPLVFGEQFKVQCQRHAGLCGQRISEAGVEIFFFGSINFFKQRNIFPLFKNLRHLQSKFCRTGKKSRPQKFFGGFFVGVEPVSEIGCRNVPLLKILPADKDELFDSIVIFFKKTPVSGETVKFPRANHTGIRPTGGIGGPETRYLRRDDGEITFFILRQAHIFEPSAEKLRAVR